MLVCRFGESLDSEVLSSAYSALKSCDLFMTIGTSSVVHPAAGFAARVLSILPSSNLCLVPSCALSLCPAPFVLCPMACALCPAPFALWHVPCTLPCTFCPVTCTLCPVPSTLCPVPCTLCPVPCNLWHVPCALLQSVALCCLCVSECLQLSQGWIIRHVTRPGSSTCAYRQTSLDWLQVAERGVPLAEVNLDTSDATDICEYVFQAGPLLPAE